MKSGSRRAKSSQRASAVRQGGIGEEDLAEEEGSVGVTAPVERAQGGAVRVPVGARGGRRGGKWILRVVFQRLLRPAY
jgi:hypothetical protein